MRIEIDADTFIGSLDWEGNPAPEGGVLPEVMIPVVVNGRPTHAVLQLELEHYSYQGNVHSGFDGSATYKIVAISV